MIFYFLSKKIIKSIFQIINEFALYYHLKITNFRKKNMSSCNYSNSSLNYLFKI